MKTKRTKGKSLWYCIICGTGAGLLTALLLSPLCGWLTEKQLWPRQEMGALSAVQWLLGGFAGSVTASLLTQKRRIPSALGAAGGLMLLRMLIGLCFRDACVFSVTSLTGMAFLALGGSLGAACSVKRRSRHI